MLVLLDAIKVPLTTVWGRLRVRFPFSSFFLFVRRNRREGETGGASKGGLDHEDGIRFFYVLHRPF
jgi:hypothetical protein